MASSSKSSISFERVRGIFFFGILGILSIAMLYIFRPFVYPIFWAAVCAAMFYPMYRKLSKATKRPKTGALMSVFVVILIIFIPLFILSALVVNESSALYEKVSASGSFATPAHVSTWLEHTPLAPYLAKIRTEWATYASEATQRISQFIFSSIKSITQNLVTLVIMSGIMLYTLYYFFKDGERMLRRLGHISPLSTQYEDMLYFRFIETVRSTLKSTIIIGGIQGTLGGVLFWITGIEGAFVWGIIMIILAILPAVGTWTVLIPASIIMLAFGNIWQSIVILCGMIVISLIDNFIRPPLVGRDTQMHPLVIFVSTLGGLIIFGVSGFVIGPVVAALYLSVLTIYDHYYNKELSKEN